MDDNLPRRLEKGSGARVYGHPLTRTAESARMPILLRAWDSQFYREWSMLFAIPAYLLMIDSGFLQSAVSDMNRMVGSSVIQSSLAQIRSIRLAGIGLIKYGLLRQSFCSR